MTLHLVTHVPEHEPREDDPHYHLFEQCKARMKRQGLWKCVINDDYCGGNVELHHAHIEYSQTNSTDLGKINEALGLHLTSDEDFQKWIESPGNLEPLCEVHHRTHFGIHVIPGPLWEPLRYRKYNAKPAAEFVTADEAEKGETVVKTKTTKTTTVHTHPTKEGVETDTAVDEKTDVKVKAAHHTVAEHVEQHHSVDKQTAPRPRKSAEKTEKPEKKKGFFSRMFGN
jgi:hypothetical protein